jgi:hypothetical protein
MTRISTLAMAAIFGIGTACGLNADDKAAAQEEKIPHSSGLTIIVRMQGPYDADVPLQVVCYFKHKADGDTTKGAPVELDKRLGGVITALRERGEFVGDELETLLLDTKGRIPARQLLLIGLGDEASLSLERLERIGRVAYREAAKAGATAAAFAPLIRDQGNDKLPAGEVETAVIRGLLLARDTDLRLQKEGLSRTYSLATWIVEAGPAYYKDTIVGARKGIESADSAIKRRSRESYSTAK